ncbi:MAG TPA: tRNA lysidine(34) synthetase TilS, partial [Acetobacteraceae bacterium]
ARLVATCRAAGQSWIDDPSNDSPAFARGRLRAASAILAAEGLTPDRLADTAHRAAGARAALEAATAALLARAVRAFPEGWLALDPAPLREAPPEIALRALSACLATTGGTTHPPRRAAVERLYADLPAPVRRGRTLAGCRILVRTRDRLILREAAACAGPAEIPPGSRVTWDGRFAVRLDPEAPSGRYRVAAAGDRTGLPGMPDGLPAAVRATLPVLERDDIPLGIPRLDGRPVRGMDRSGPTGAVPASARFAPCHPLARPAFLVVSLFGGII